MPQDDKAREPSVTFKAKAGLPSDPQPMEIHAAEGDLKPWDLDSLPGFQHVGKPHPRFDGPLKVTGRAKYTYDVKLPGMLYGRMVGASIPVAVASTGADLQTVKTAAHFGLGGTLIPTGIYLLDRFGRIFAPQWTLARSGQGHYDHFTAPGVVNLVTGLTDLVLAAIFIAQGIRYHRGDIQAAPTPDIFFLGHLDVGPTWDGEGVMVGWRAVF